MYDNGNLEGWKWKGSMCFWI